MKAQGATMTQEISEFRARAEELVKLVDTLKEDNTRKLYDYFVDTRERRKSNME